MRQYREKRQKEWRECFWKLVSWKNYKETAENVNNNFLSLRK